VTRTGIDIAGTTDAQDGACGGNVGGGRFRPISNPATSEWIQFTDVAEYNGEDMVRFNWRSMPGGAITEHVHPHQEERFTIIAGEAHFTVNGEERVVRPGQTIVVPVGVRHSEANPGLVEIEGVVELRPALQSKQMHEAFAGLGTELKTTSRGAPKNPLQLGATVWHFRHESRATSPPIWVQNLVLPPLSMLAKVFGVRPYHDRWDTRIGEPSELTPIPERPEMHPPSSRTDPVSH
jgi:mannose-6-phosphate isomerase-like protein (cupin superfamily)